MNVLAILTQMLSGSNYSSTTDANDLEHFSLLNDCKHCLFYSICFCPLNNLCLNNRETIMFIILLKFQKNRQYFCRYLTKRIK